MRKWHGNPWAVLLTLSLGFFMTLLDLTIVNIAMPSMIDKLHASLDEVLWVVNAYTLVLAVLLITAGRLGDLRGPRNMFIGGVALFTVASVLCALAQDPTQLIAARVVQGLGAAALMPQTMTIIISTFPAERRGAALGIWGAVAGVATIAGPTLGGFLVSIAGWQWIFLVNVPIGALVLVLAFTVLPNTRQDMKHKLDMTGVVVVTVGLFCLTFGLTEGQRYDWNAWIWGLLAASGVLFVLFLLYQRTRQDKEPLLPFALFRDRNYAVMSFVSATVSIGMIGLFLPMTLYLQSVLHFSALKAGLVMAPVSFVSMLLAPFAGRLSDRIGGKYILMTGLALYALGMLWMTLIASVGSQWYSFLPALIVAGVGVGGVFAPMATVAMHNVEPRMAGAASGVMNTIRQIGSVLGSAMVGALLQNRLASTLPEEAAQRSGAIPPAYRDAFIAGFKGAAKKGFEVGAGQAGTQQKPPPGTPANVVHQLQQAAASVFGHGFVHAMRPSMLVPIAVLFLGTVSCMAARRRRIGRPGAPEPVEVGSTA